MAFNELYSQAIDFLRLRKRAYQLTFQQPLTHPVLKDLVKFCHAAETPKTSDPFFIGVHTGRREVWLRIQHHLHLNEEQLFQLYGQVIPSVKTVGEKK